MTSLTSIVIALAVAGRLIVRQVQVRPVGEGRIPLALAVVGLLQFTSQSGRHPVDAASLGLIGGSLLLGVLLGGWRATTVRVWWDGRQAMRQGSSRTVWLWLVSIGSHLAIAALAHGRAATADQDATLLYLGVTLAVQQVVLLARARSAVYGVPVPLGSSST